MHNKSGWKNEYDKQKTVNIGMETKQHRQTAQQSQRSFYPNRLGCLHRSSLSEALITIVTSRKAKSPAT